ncbi:hypothetical protein [Cognatilysobacter xinjiangensis]|uniref:hypothetical protein n=1 Tax=Cognatilysobacter xinjiangensis TaxID=546892 RepID=UPI00167980CF|nr:hypothetical protein [Lysobacter xinjiangensis]
MRIAHARLDGGRAIEVLQRRLALAAEHREKTGDVLRVGTRRQSAEHAVRQSAGDVEQRGRAREQRQLRQDGIGQRGDVVAFEQPL